MIYRPLNGNELIFNMEKFVEPTYQTSTYKALSNAECRSEIELFCWIRDFICKKQSVSDYDFSTTGIGYDLIDSFYDSDEYTPILDDWYVIKSVNENGLTTYFKITYQNASYLSVVGFRYWNTTTQEGINPFYETGAHIPISATSRLSIYGDKSSLAIIVSVSDVPSLFMFGTTENSSYDQKILSCDTALSAGSDLEMILNNNIDSYIDDKVFIFDTENIELSTIKNIDISLKSIYLDLLYSYPNGASVTTDLCLFIQATNDLTSADNFKLLIDGTGNVNVAVNWDVFSTLLDQHDPSGLNDDYLSSEISLSGSGFHGYLRHIRILGSGVDLQNNSVFNDRYNNWRLFTINGYKLLFREP